MCFIASPVEESEEKLVSLAKKLKKNNIGVDIINLGEYHHEHIRKLAKFVETINTADDNSHFINIPPSNIANMTA